MSESIKTYIQDLFRYLEDYESNYSEFKTEAFFQTYNGIFAVFQALRKQRDKAVEVDLFFLENIKQAPLSSSDLRQLTIQILITFFESEADTDGQSNQAYLHCRDLRSIKRDAAFFEEHLVPLLYREGSLNNNLQLNDFFLKEISRYINKFARGIRTDMNPEEFDALPEHHKLLELSRRRLELGDQLAKDRNSLEFQLQRIGVFNKLSEKSRIFDHYLRQWDYLITTSFWSRLKSSLGVIWGKFKGLFKSFNYFRLSLLQRKPAFLYYGLIIIIFILLAIYVPMRWKSYSMEKYQEFERQATDTREAISK